MLDSYCFGTSVTWINQLCKIFFCDDGRHIGICYSVLYESNKTEHPLLYLQQNCLHRNFRKISFWFYPFYFFFRVPDPTVRVNLLFSNIAALIKSEADSIVKQKAFIKNKWGYQSKRTFIIGEVKALVPELLFLPKEISSIIKDLILKASKKRSQIHPGRFYERSKKNRERKHLRTRKSVF